MTKERIQILVDASRDTGHSNGLIQIEPDDIYQTTDNRDYLSKTVLKNYDVLAICNSTALKYTDAELKLIREFVENGGGLLLAAGTSHFERDVREPIAELGINKIAALFGARFLTLAEGAGEIDTDVNPLRGYTKQSLRFTDHEIVAGLSIDDLAITHCGILDIPKDAEVFLEHSETREPVGGCLHFGTGRVLLINHQLFQKENHSVAGQFIDWLGINHTSLVTGDETIPDEIPVEEQVKEEGKIKIFYTNFVADRVNTCLEFAKKLTDEMLAKFPKGEKIEWKIDLIPSCVHDYGFDWSDSVMTIGACVSDARLAYSLGVEVCGLLEHRTPFGKAHSVISEAERFDGFQFLFGIWAMKQLGFGAEVATMTGQVDRQFREIERTRKAMGIKEQSLQSIWILKALTEKYGDELFVRLTQTVSEKGHDIGKNIPHSTFSRLDRLVYYLSLTVDKDLFPWFEAIRTTVHPLPLLPNESDEFAASVRERLNAMIRDTAADTSDRTDAITSILAITDEDKQEDSALVAKLEAEDRYERLIAATKLVTTCDHRAMKALEALTGDTEDDGLGAIAILALVRNGQGGDIIERLVEIAPHQDYRYQLEAGYLLEKIGHEAAERFSYKGLTDENGAAVVTMDCKHNGELQFVPTIAGHRVATCNSMLQTHHFPYNTHVPGIYMSWVHTEDKFRRKGLSRWAFGKTMSHQFVRQYSCVSLYTGTRNPAHPMYRSFGFVDGLLEQTLTKTLRHEETKVVEGLVVRPYTPGDEVAMATVLNAFYADQVERRPRRARRRRTSETRLIKLAEKDGEMLGYVQVQCDDKEKSVSIIGFCLNPQPSEGSEHPEGFLEAVGAALLCTLHNDLVKREYKKISWYPEGEMEKAYVRRLFNNFGYSSEETDWVWMFKIINLPMLLNELAPLLSKRLNKSNAYKDWQGTICIKTPEHQASITIKDGEIRASAEVPEDTGIRLSTDNDTLTQFILGVTTPYEAYLQNELHIASMVNSSVERLLETLFPRRRKGNA
jgi:uncharacterized membrane protein